MAPSGGDAPDIKDVVFAAGAHDEMQDMPGVIRAEFGHALWIIQGGKTPTNASPFEGSRANEVMKLTERHDGDTYRCVYAAKFERAVYVLHVFQKKGKSGVATPRKDIETVNTRLQDAKADYEERYKVAPAHPKEEAK